MRRMRWKFPFKLGIIALLCGACGGDSKDEFDDGGSTASSGDSFVITSVLPEDNATDVSVSTSVAAVFSDNISSVSVTGENFSVSTNSGQVSGTLSHKNALVVWLPASSLSSGTAYSVTVSGTVQNTSGKTLGSSKIWGFTTASASSDNSSSSSDNSTSGDSGTSSDTTAPGVSSISPSDNATGIAVNSSIIVAFNESVSSSSISSGTFKLTDNVSNSVNGSFTVSGATVTFTPTDNLTHFRDYTVFLTTAIQDLAGNALSSAKSWSFQTLANVVVTSADSNGMVLLSGGSFEMGADNESQNSFLDETADELPVHTVTLTGPFYISDHEVTANEFKSCVDAGSCTYSGSTTASKRTYDVPGKGDYPVNYVNWDDAGAYATWLTATRSGTYRLCTEAEWEYAARAGSTTMWSCGDNSCAPTIAWYDNAAEPKQGKTKNPNQWGLYDMSGNVREWVSDYYSATYYTEVANGVTNPQGSDSVSPNRVIRGGYYNSKREDVRSASREYKKATTTRKAFVGFRVCADP